MRLNGWLRLWIVLSVCWLAFVGYSAYSDISSLYTKKRFEVTKVGIGSAQFLFSASQSDTEIEEHITKKLTPLVEKDPKTYVGKTDATPYEKYVEKHAGSEIMKHIELALLPIIGLLALGWSFVWVRRGFSQKSNTLLFFNRTRCDSGAVFYLRGPRWLKWRYAAYY